MELFISLKENNPHKVSKFLQLYEGNVALLTDCCNRTPLVHILDTYTPVKNIRHTLLIVDLLINADADINRAKKYVEENYHKIVEKNIELKTLYDKIKSAKDTTVSQNAELMPSIGIIDINDDNPQSHPHKVVYQKKSSYTKMEYLQLKVMAEKLNISTRETHLSLRIIERILNITGTTIDELSKQNN